MSFNRAQYLLRKGKQRRFSSNQIMKSVEGNKNKMVTDTIFYLFFDRRFPEMQSTLVIKTTARWMPKKRVNSEVQNCFTVLFRHVPFSQS